MAVQNVNKGVCLHYRLYRIFKGVLFPVKHFDQSILQSQKLRQCKLALSELGFHINYYN